MREEITFEVFKSLPTVACIFSVLLPVFRQLIPNDLHHMVVSTNVGANRTGRIEKNRGKYTTICEPIV
jgi:hypothetical protein